MSWGFYAGVFILPLMVIRVFTYGSTGSFKIQLVLFAFADFGFYRWAPSPLPALIYITALWLLIFFGAARVSAWQAVEYRGKVMSNVEKWMVALSILFTAGSLWVLIARLGMALYSFRPPFSFGNIIAEIVLPFLLAAMWYELLFGVMLYILTPLFSFGEEQRTAKLEDYFVYRRIHRRAAERYYYVKFEGDPIYWMVNLQQFKGYAEKLGSLYEYTSIKGLFGRRYMREKPVLVQYAGVAGVNKINPKYRLTPTRLDYKKFPYLIMMIIGLMLIIGGIFYSCVLIIGWRKPELRGTIKAEAALPVAVLAAGVLLLVTAIRRIRKISREKERF